MAGGRLPWLALHVRGMSPCNVTKGKGKHMAKSTITSKGQTTVPARVRAALHTEPGTCLEWQVTPDGDVIVRAKNLSILDLAGSGKTDKRHRGHGSLE